MATLFLTCGLPCVGKTTLATRVATETRALRLTADEWLRELYPQKSEVELDGLRERVEDLQWRVAARALELGCYVVLDWGLWSREERDIYRSRAHALGARAVLCVLEVPLDELWERISQRNSELPPGAFRISRAELDRAAKLFQRPTSEEMKLFDAA